MDHQLSMKLGARYLISVDKGRHVMDIPQLTTAAKYFQQRIDSSSDNDYCVSEVFVQTY